MDRRYSARLLLRRLECAASKYFMFFLKSLIHIDLDMLERFLMKKNRAHVMSLLTLPDPSLHHGLEIE